MQWNSFQRGEKIVIALCLAALTFCAGSEFARRRQPLPPLFHEAAR